MTNNTLADEIDIICQTNIKQIAYPIKCKITKVYSDNIHADITSSKGDITYVETISNNLTKGNIGILIFLNNNPDEYIVLTR